MSTYYYHHCTKCQLSGGLFTRQAWGCGNADLIDTFKFVMWHISECGPEYIGMHSEHEDDQYSNTNCDLDGGHRRQHLNQTAHIFSRSNDWQFMAEAPPGTDLEQLWLEQELAELEPPKKDGHT